MVRAKKNLGQHFLRDENIARKIVGCLDPNITEVVEIGPGMGVLSKYLLSTPGVACWFLEVDRESVEYLRHQYPVIGDRLIEADFLRFDLLTLPFQSRGFAIIGNFPYNISSQILFKVLDYRDRIPEVIGMFQKEVAERIAAPPGSRTYGILSVILQAYYNIEYLFTVNESVFSPPPKVKSAVIRLRRNQVERLDCDEEFFRTLVKTAFNQRRKTLRNAIRSLLNQGVAIDPAILDKRAEQLSVQDFVRLAAEISNFAKTESADEKTE